MAINYIENMQNNSFQDISWSTLKKADRTIAVPFILKLHEHEHALYCEKLIRVIPGKRMVLFGTWENKPIVAKLFFSRKAKAHSKRDVAGIELLNSVNIPTPKLLFQGTDKSRRIHLLIFERIVDSCNLDLLWQEKGDVEELIPLMRAVTIELATQHVLGIVQKDLHLKNFLVTSKTIYTLDGGSIEQCDSPLSKKDSLDHLGLFFSQLGVGTEKLLQDLFTIYSQSRGWIVRPADRECLSQATKKYHVERWLRYQKKIMRDCTAFDRIDKFSHLTMYDRDYQSTNFKLFLAHPDAFFAKAGAETLKSGRSSTVAKIKLDNRVLVVKRYNIKGFWHWLRRCLRPSRAYSSWHMSHHLRLMDVPTAKPIAFIEKRFFGLRYKSYFVMEYVQGKHLGEYFSQSLSDNEAFLRIGNRVLRIFQQLAELQMTHGDLKMTNIIISHDKPILLDLDGMREHQHYRSFKRVFKKEIQRFMKNWDVYPRVKEMFQKLLVD